MAAHPMAPGAGAVNGSTSQWARVQPTPRLVADVVDVLDLAGVTSWSDLGGSWTANLRLDRAGGAPLVARVYPLGEVPGRLAGVQAARTAVAAAGVPALSPIRRGGAPFQRLSTGHLVEVEAFIASDATMNRPPTLEAGFPTLARVHDALRTADLPPEAADSARANYLPADGRSAAVRQGATRMRQWEDPLLRLRADEVLRLCDAVDAAESGLVAGQRSQVVHGDYWDNNVLLLDGQVSAVLDFDFMGLRPRVDDLALGMYFHLQEPGRGLPTLEDRTLVRRLADGYDAAAAIPLSAAERASLPLAIARQPAWLVGRWIAELDDSAALAQARKLARELPVAQAVLRDISRWQDALT